MKRSALIVAIFVVLVSGLWLINRFRSQTAVGGGHPPGAAGETVATGVEVTAIATSPGAETGRPSLLLGEKILRDYAKTNLPPENDLTLMAHLMDNFTLLVKSADSRPLSANEDWAAALRGQNPAHERFLPDRHVALNADGKLVDRWGTPLFFHALGGGRWEIRSAGPDGKLWTADDLHRNADGAFRRGAELNPSSLLESSSRSPTR